MTPTTRECLRYAPMLGSREGELEAGERAALAAHLEGCAGCQARLADLAATEGLVAEGLSRAAARRDFSAFADEVMARIEPESSGWRAFLRRHRIAVRVATALAPALAAVALILYLERGPGGAALDVDVTSELYVPIVIQTADGPVVLLGNGDQPEGS